MMGASKKMFVTERDGRAKFWREVSSNSSTVYVDLDNIESFPSKPDGAIEYAPFLLYCLTHSP